MTGDEEHRAFELFIAQRGAELLQDRPSLGRDLGRVEIEEHFEAIAGRSFFSTTWVIYCRSLHADPDFTGRSGEGLMMIFVLSMVSRSSQAASSGPVPDT